MVTAFAIALFNKSSNSVYLCFVTILTPQLSHCSRSLASTSSLVGVMVIGRIGKLGMRWRGLLEVAVDWFVSVLGVLWLVDTVVSVVLAT